MSTTMDNKHRLLAGANSPRSGHVNELATRRESAPKPLSIVIPTFNEEDTIVRTLESLQQLRRQDVEIIVVDGGSCDDTVSLAKPLSDRVGISPRGRAAQMNAGAARARGDIVLFLHADTWLPPQTPDLVRNALANSGRVWGRFDVSIDSHNPVLRMVSCMMNWRSRLSGIATGDQAIFVFRADFVQVGGFPNLPLMEDIALSKKLRRLSWPSCIATPATTSARRWERQGILRTILLMWHLRWAYFWGTEPADLAVRYGYGARHG